ncbi:hypothetical protein HETIRDRAFT_322548 [Heterobasidion irregulare TC 32-1]|uniref:Uncharacterized protein n=1 Tax=Heterobasidion irregulare (strain TC 32-1) TaxID=747525 RepID=W4K0Y1_HETIT|nr:uncharacterized protein HETIRDRAFT_322548 [Heterobasidion irregulare TC 32-1]ETW79457.1 hypothetical protein HETIRDRAFT_322548 [Heterobasidion irregulare TC 32-1]
MQHRNRERHKEPAHPGKTAAELRWRTCPCPEIQDTVPIARVPSSNLALERVQDSPLAPSHPIPSTISDSYHTKKTLYDTARIASHQALLLLGRRSRRPERLDPLLRALVQHLLQVLSHQPPVGLHAAQVPAQLLPQHLQHQRRQLPAALRHDHDGRSGRRRPRPRLASALAVSVDLEIALRGVGGGGGGGSVPRRGHEPARRAVPADLVQAVGHGVEAGVGDEGERDGGGGDAVGDGCRAGGAGPGGGGPDCVDLERWVWVSACPVDGKGRGERGRGSDGREGGKGDVRPVTNVRTSKARTNGRRPVAMTPCLMAPDLAALRSALKRCWRSSAGKFDG